MRSYLGLALSCVVIVSGCSSKTVVHPATSSAPSINGIPYALPLTVVTTTITVARTDAGPGPYAGYVTCFFPELTADDLVNKVTYVPSITYKLKAATFDTKGVPDAKHVYVIDSHAGWLHKKALNAQLNETGILSKSDVEMKNETLSFTLSTLKTLATIAGAVVSTLPATQPLKDQYDTNELSQRLQTVGACSDRLTTMIDRIKKLPDTEQKGQALNLLTSALQDINGLKNDLTNSVMEAESMPQESQSGAAADFDKVPKAEREKLKQAKFHMAQTTRRYNTSDFAAASDSFSRLKQLQDARRQSIAGFPAGNLSVEALKELLDEYSKQESSLVSLFLGAESVDTWVPMFEPDPPHDPFDKNGGLQSGTIIENVDLFRYLPTGSSSTESGICLEKSFANISIPAKFKTSSCGDSKKKFTTIKMSLSTDFSKEIASTFMKVGNNGGFDDASINAGERSYFFRIPSRAQTSITQCVDHGSCNALFPPKVLSIAQWGVIASLPADTGGSRTKYSVELYGSTGALSNFAMDSDSQVSTADLSQLESGAKAITDPLAARRKSSLDRLTNEEQMLEQQCKINAIKKIEDPALDCSSVLSE